MKMFDNPHIVHFVDARSSRDDIGNVVNHIVMEYCGDVDLYDYVCQRGAL